MRWLDGVQPRELLAELLDQRLSNLVEARIAHQPVRRCFARQSSHDVEIAPDGRAVGANPQRFRHFESRLPGDLEHRELFGTRAAGGNRGRCIGAQHERVATGHDAAAEAHVEGVVLLHGAAAQTIERNDLEGIAVAHFGEKLPEPVAQLFAGRDFAVAAVQPHDQNSVPSSIRLRDSTILCTSEAPSTSRAWRA